MRISDWSSDVCSSDLGVGHGRVDRRVPGALCVEVVDRDLVGVVHVQGGRPLLRGRGLIDPVDIPAERAIVDREHRQVRSKRLLALAAQAGEGRSEENTSELQSLMRTSYAVFFLTQKQ